MKPKHPAEAVGRCNRKSSMYVQIKHSRPNHVHVTVAKVVRESNSVRHHHVASLGEVKHSGRHADGRYKFAVGVRETLWQWVENILASEHFEATTAVEFRDAVAKKIRPPTLNQTGKRQSTLPGPTGSSGGTTKSQPARR
jgi:hypothetical protein